MARPESINDIELDEVEFGSIEVNKIATDGALLKGYAAFLEAVQKSGSVSITEDYRGVHFHRKASGKEAADQLRTAQYDWDERKKFYEQLRDVGTTEYEVQTTLAKEWAEKEGLPFPPEHDPIEAFDAVIRDIDDVVGA